MSLHFSVQSLQEYIGENWKIFQDDIFGNKGYRLTIQTTLNFDELSIPCLTKTMRELFITNKFIVAEIEKLQFDLDSTRKELAEKENEIERLKQYETYYLLHKEMLGSK